MGDTYELATGDRSSRLCKVRQNPNPLGYVVRLDSAQLPKLKGCPPNVVLPSEEEVTACAELSLVVLPDESRDINDPAPPAQVTEGLDHPSFQDGFLNHGDLPRTALTWRVVQTVQVPRELVHST